MLPSSAQETLRQIGEEIAHAKAGGDEALLPVYSLLGEFTETLPEGHAHTTTGTQLRDRIESLFEGDGYWTDELITAIKAFALGEPLPEAPLSTPDRTPTPQETSIPTDSSSADQLLVLDLDENRELLEEFVNEAAEHLDQIEEALLKLEHAPGDTPSIHSLFRSFHTIKGVSGFLQLDPINALSHQVESLLDLAREGRLTLESDIISLLLQARDRLAGFLKQMQMGLAEDRQPTEIISVASIIEAVKACALDRTKVPTQAPSVETPSGSAPARLQIPATPTAEVNQGGDVGTAMANALGGFAEPTIRVRTDKLDTLVDAVGELVILEAQLITAIGETPEDSALQKHLNQLRRIVRGIQDSAMSIRMVPIRPTFRKMERLARELGRGLSKQVDLVLHGEETELDRTMVEVISDPLVHMLRNAVDHGIESPAERIAAGKSERGTISLSAYHQGGFITLQLADDGRGLNTEQIRKKALSRKLIQPHQNLTDPETHRLIFEPGFTTAEEVSGISGRGVGMDVVRRNIEALRGSIDIESTEGHGSVFTIKVPLTLAIIDGLVIKVANDIYILPATSVRVAIQPEERDIKCIHGKGETLTLRDEIIPLHYLHRLFSIHSSITRASDGIVVIIDAFNRTYGLVVDELISKQEVVIKSLGPITKDLPGLLGGAILGDGSIALILDPLSLVAGSSNRSTVVKASA